MSASFLEKLARRAALVGICGVVALFLYASFFGGNRYLPILYYVFIAFLVEGVAATLVPRWLRFNANMRQTRKQDVGTGRMKFLFWLGLLLCALPVPWFYFLSREFGGPSGVSSIVAFAPAIAFLAIGVCLLFHSYFTWARAIFQRISLLRKKPNATSSGNDRT